jgi:hypothetical protein
MHQMQQLPHKVELSADPKAKSRRTDLVQSVDGHVIWVIGSLRILTLAFAITLSRRIKIV